MQKRTLGKSGLEVSALGLGCMGMSFSYGPPKDKQEMIALIRTAVERGVNFFDTADVYGWKKGEGITEQIIGRWFAQGGGRRDKVVLATKVYGDMGDWPNENRLSALHIRKACEASLKRLQTDYIDLYQSHRDDESTPQEETLGIYAELIHEGKVRAIGASSFTAVRLESALELSRKHNLPRYETLQPEYNLYTRSGYEGTIEKTCVKHGLGVIPYYSLASGFLSGKYRTADEAASRPRAAMLKRYFTKRGMRIVKSLDKVACDVNAGSAQVALAWLMARPSITAPIASATTLAQLHELVRATQLTLSESAIEELNLASAETAVA